MEPFDYVCRINVFVWVDKLLFFVSYDRDIVLLERWCLMFDV